MLGNEFHHLVGANKLKQWRGIFRPFRIYSGHSKMTLSTSMATIFFGEFLLPTTMMVGERLKYRLHFYRAIAKLCKVVFTCALPPYSQPNCYLQLPVSISAVRDFIILRIPGWFTIRIIYLLLSTQSTLCRSSKMCIHCERWQAAHLNLSHNWAIGCCVHSIRFHRTKRKVINFLLVPATESISSHLGRDRPLRFSL